MNGTPHVASASPLKRWAVVLAVAICSAAMLGAGEAHSARLTLNVAPKSTANAAVTALGTGRELMQDVIPAASVEPMSSTTDAHMRIVWLEVTAYCGCPKCCGPHAQGLTASGRSIAYNGGQFVAADKKLFKFGTRLSIPGYAGGQPVEVIDRGGAIKGYHIDVFFPTHEQAREWGRKRIAVTVEE
jgi:3D (Asp-Asp-Asp) domain-containing protein